MFTFRNIFFSKNKEKYGIKDFLFIVSWLKELFKLFFVSIILSNESA